MSHLLQAVDYQDSIESLVDLLELRAATCPLKIAYTYLRDSDGTAIALSYAQLAQRARAIGAYLQATRMNRERVVLLFPPGLDYIAAFFGCLYAGAIAVPAYAPRLSARNKDAEFQRLQALLEDAQATAILTTTETLARLSPDNLAQLDSGRRLWLSIDAIADATSGDWRKPVLQGEDLAFLQYTSGSTAAPRGVMLSHGALLSNLAQIQRNFRIQRHSQGVIWLPPYHDMGLIGGILEPVYSAIPVTLMAPVTAMQRPLFWLRAISGRRSIISGGPNFAFELCTNKITPEQRGSLDLSGWEVAFCGAEPIRPQTLSRFADYFAVCGFQAEAFHPCYGLAEATVFVTGTATRRSPRIARLSQTALLQGIAAPSSDQDDNHESVSCGWTDRENRVLIVDPDTCGALPDGAVGEIWVTGPGVALGYWNRPLETEKTFRGYLNNGIGPWLRTGDLGFMRDGEIYITGRLKDLILIRGRNHYPQDIEHTVEQCHPVLRPHGSAAFSVEHDGEERLVVVQEIQQRHAGMDFKEITTTIRQAISDKHQLQASIVMLVKTGAVPKTSSGKIQRQKCKAYFIAGQLQQIFSN